MNLAKSAEKTVTGAVRDSRGSGFDFALTALNMGAVLTRTVPGAVRTVAASTTVPYSLAVYRGTEAIGCKRGVHCSGWQNIVLAVITEKCSNGKSGLPSV